MWIKINNELINMDKVISINGDFDNNKISIYYNVSDMKGGALKGEMELEKENLLKVFEELKSFIDSSYDLIQLDT